MTHPCIFCSLPQDRVAWQNELCYAVRDAFPVSPGHTLVIPHRHVPTWFEATREEQLAVLEALDILRNELEAELHPDGFNIGINAGAAAGQTVFHLHVHLIPRYHGDVPDPRGGVRHVIPWKGRYAPASPGDSTPHPRPLVAGMSEPAHPDPLFHHLRPSLRGAAQIDILVAFLMGSGLRRLETDLRDALARGARVRVVTGDYLEVTDAEALRRLLDLGAGLEAWVFEARDHSFHPKSWIVREAGGEGAAFVGSSNMSHAALLDGIEWNLRVSSREQPHAFADVARAFEELLRHPRMRRLTPQWIERYEAQIALTARVPDAGVAALEAPPEVVAEGSGARVLVPGDVEGDGAGTDAVPEPHGIQREALRALEDLRSRGERAALVVLATGLGKTYLAAFDSNRPEFRRVLFVAHREEILAQAMRTFARVRPEARLGQYAGDRRDVDADVVFASVQTLARQAHLKRFADDHFDYVVVDEFHHAEARTYQRLLEWFSPRFLLGLTATPERTDGADLLRLVDGHLAFHCDVAEGIGRGLLCPFHYLGVPDDVDYANIPWRSGHFDPEALEQAVATQARARNAFEQWQRHAGRRTLAFCCSQRHADFMASWFDEHGVRAVAVHSGETSAPRALSMQQLEDGVLQVVFAVDLFNEGLDMPEIDTVLMLRPTESRILFLQQLGRGLRLSASKERLAVIDYIGNHRCFLMKPRALLGLPQGDSWMARLLEDLKAGEPLDLPPGCEVTYELEAVQILEGLIKKDRSAELRAWYDDFTREHGRRPQALEAFLGGFNPRAARASHGGWLGFVEAQGGLTDAERMALGAARPYFEELERGAMTRSYKMVVMRAMTEAHRLPGTMPVDDLVDAVAGLLGDEPRLRDDFPGDVLAAVPRRGRRDVGQEAERDRGAAQQARKCLAALLRKNPLHYLTTGPGSLYFTLDDGRLVARIAVPDEAHEALRNLTRELVAWRLEDYLQRPGRGLTLGDSGFSCKVIRNSGGKPILMFDRTRETAVPVGWTPVTIDGETCEANFVKIALNVVRRPGKSSNVLPDILTRWFGEQVGAPGTMHRVEFTREDGRWSMRRVGG